MQSNNQFLPPRKLGQRLPSNITAEDSIAAWIDLMRTTDKLVLARFVAQVGSVKAGAAYREWLTAEAHKPRAYKEKMARQINSMGISRVD